jgi:hypothetical protein
MEDIQLRLFGCEHRVETECFTTIEGRWSPHFVSICILCGQVNGYPDTEWLRTWPKLQQTRLTNFLKRSKYGALVCSCAVGSSPTGGER